MGAIPIQVVIAKGREDGRCTRPRFWGELEEKEVVAVVEGARHLAMRLKCSGFVGAPHDCEGALTSGQERREARKDGAI